MTNEDKLDILVEKIKKREIEKGFVKIKINRNGEVGNITIEKDFEEMWEYWKMKKVVI